LRLGLFLLLCIVVVVGMALLRTWLRTGRPPVWTQEEKENATHFFRSLGWTEKALSYASKRMNHRKPAAGLTEADSQQIVSFLQKALGEGLLVSHNMLAKSHPKLPEVFKEKYIRSLELTTAGEGSPEEASALINQWNDWLEANKNDLIMPKDVLNRGKQILGEVTDAKR
jgi:hypothetical protein